MISRQEVRERARRHWDRHARKWAAGDTSSATLDLPLHPPTEKGAIADLPGTRAWVDSWRDLGGVVWETRRWSRVGPQQIPTRVILSGPDEIASMAGVSRQWHRWLARTQLLLQDLGEDARPALITNGRAIRDMEEVDFQRLRGVVAWLRSNPVSGRFVRELPIRGIDSKWLERRLKVVTALVGTEQLGLRRPPTLLRTRFLGLGPTDVSMPVAEAACIEVDAPVLIVENLQTFLAVPRSLGVVVVAGQGDAVEALAGVNWARNALYWGDLDSHGLRILHRARSAGMNLRSVLMDSTTLYEFQDLWVPEPNPHSGALPRLTEDEAATLAALRAEGDVRLEQERISWDYALGQLERADLQRHRLTAGQ